MKQYLLHTNFLAIVACLLWASAFTGVKYGLAFASPLHFAGVRFFWAGIILLPFALRSGNYFKIIRNNAGKVFIIALLQIILQYILFYKGLSLVQGAVGAIIIGSGPMFVALLSHFFIADDKLNWRMAGIIVLGLCGVVLVSIGRNGDAAANKMAFLGLVYLLGVNLASGLVNVYIKKQTSKLPPLVLSSSTMIFGGAAIYILSVFFEGVDFTVKPPEYYAALAWLTFLSATAFSIWFYLLKRPEVKVSFLNLWKFLIPVAGAILAWVVLPDEAPNVSSVAGVIITGGALILLNLSRRKTV